MITISLPTYDIEIEQGLLNQLNEKIKTIYKYNKLFIITDETVHELYQEKVNQILKEFEVYWIKIKPGEKSKSILVYEETINHLIDLGIKRNHLIIALGGGVVGDLAGFIASSIYRGLPYIQVPTTLLAQVDSSVGGKTGIDTSRGKNLIGAFYNPKYVLIDPNVLETLEPLEYANGIAEMIKCGLIGNKELYLHLKNKKPITKKEIAQAINVKVNVVKIDPFDQKERMYLNFGHTFGHAIEKRHHYEKYKHGQAISYGMLIALELGIQLGITPNYLYDEVKEMFLYYKLINEPLLDKKDYLDLIALDKKNIADKLHFIFIEDIEKPIIKPVRSTDI
ncbi:3-dehydroquinate synthase [Alteracholeplasma palmae J233]|uniref:3-dehydroquinate synthase n=1 Tax=Alteracholeplasma palmae (strain ATCC 49389 / J233) TaxID=1318466 RepID=U4KLH3_ALTPJ|nr:3-dehydroquinate synthase [Alteracholeplasma palmae]CCV64794.1 3-dehydroquinate synthase [Alteracholeplasma palmae J233]